VNRFFITPDIQTALGALSVDKNLGVVCVDQGNVVDKLQKEGYKIFSYEKETGRTILRNSKLLLMQPETKKYINSFKGLKQFVFFKPPLLPQKLLADYQFPTILNNDAHLSSQIENKLYLKNFNVKTPKEITNPVEFPVVLQYENGYAGNSTFVVHNDKDLQTLISSRKGDYKIVEYIKNNGTYTNNCFCYNDKVLISELFFQYTGIPQLTRTKLGSCGNNYFVNIDENIKKQIKLYSKNIGEHLLSVKYRGFFGIDFVLSKGGEVFVVEVNPRFTASISFFTQLEKLSDTETFFEKQIKVFSGDNKQIETRYNSILRGKRLLVRNDTFEDKIVKGDYKSGIYKIENGQFVFLRENFFVEDLNGQEVLLFIKNKGFVAKPETDIINFYTLSNIPEETIVNALINLKNQIM